MADNSDPNDAALEHDFVLGMAINAAERMRESLARIRSGSPEEKVEAEEELRGQYGAFSAIISSLPYQKAISAALEGGAAQRAVSPQVPNRRSFH